MKKLGELSSHEIQEISEAVASVSERAKQPLQLNELLEKWKRFVFEVEHGYKDSIYEYTNDLSVRDLLQEISLSVEANLRTRLLSVIEPWDQSFYAATREAKSPLRPNIPGKELPTWWLRVPKELGDELKEDFRSEGIIE